MMCFTGAKHSTIPAETFISLNLVPVQSFWIFFGLLHFLDFLGEVENRFTNYLLLQL
jgi:hypothetical protein